MARLVSTLTFRTRGFVECKRSLASVGEACQNAYLDIEEIDSTDGCLTFQGMRITRMDINRDEAIWLMTIRPTASMVIFIGWLMANLPSTASVNWVDGWPMVKCPPNDDCDYEDDPTPLAPDELELV